VKGKNGFRFIVSGSRLKDNKQDLLQDSNVQKESYLTNQKPETRNEKQSF